MSDLHRDWEHLIERAETEPDLDTVRKCVEEVETALVLGGMEPNSQNGQLDRAELRRISGRLLKLKTERLKWPDPFRSSSSASND